MVSNDVKFLFTLTPIIFQMLAICLQYIEKNDIILAYSKTINEGDVVDYILVILIMVAVVSICLLAIYFTFRYFFPDLKKSKKYLSKNNLISETDLILTGQWLQEKAVDYSILNVASNTSGLIVPGLAGILYGLAPFRLRPSAVVLNDNEIKFYLTDGQRLTKKHLNNPYKFSIKDIKAIYHYVEIDRKLTYAFELNNGITLRFRFKGGFNQEALDQFIESNGLAIKNYDEIDENAKSEN